MVHVGCSVIVVVLVFFFSHAIEGSQPIGPILVTLQKRPAVVLHAQSLLTHAHVFSKDFGLGFRIARVANSTRPYATQSKYGFFLSQQFAQNPNGSIALGTNFVEVSITGYAFLDHIRDIGRSIEFTICVWIDLNTYDIASPIEAKF